MTGTRRSQWLVDLYDQPPADGRVICADNQIELVYLSTRGSWLNWVEAEFAALECR